MHEAAMHDGSAFVTLTYDDDYLPDDYSVDLAVFQKFMKRLRKRLPKQIRFFACGEYGDETQRPHYHALIFGWAFPDRVFFKHDATGDLFTSPFLSEVWTYGHASLGAVTYASARYVSSYITQKRGGDLAPAHYLRTHPRSGQVVRVRPEFQTQSGKPGIGAGWFDKFKDDCFPSDFLVVEGRQVGVPRYYTNKLKEEELERIKRKRKLRAAQPAQKANRTKDRLAVRETVRLARISKLKRPL